MNLRNVIERMVKQGASDLHLKVGIPPVLRIDGELKTMKEEPLTGDELRKTAASLMTREQQDIFVRDKEIDFAIGISGVARFRVNVYLQRGSIAVAMRVIPHVHKTIEELNLPPILKDLAAKPRGEEPEYVLPSVGVNNPGAHCFSLKPSFLAISLCSCSIFWFWNSAIFEHFMHIMCRGGRRREGSRTGSGRRRTDGQWPGRCRPAASSSCRRWRIRCSVSFSLLF